MASLEQIPSTSTELPTAASLTAERNEEGSQLQVHVPSTDEVNKQACNFMPKIDNTRSTNFSYFPFKKLPAELRNMVYDLALASDKRIIASWDQLLSFREEENGSFKARFRSCWTQCIPGLLKAISGAELFCLDRQIRSEALAVLLRNNTIVVEDRLLWDLYRFLDANGCRSLPNLHITGMYFDVPPTLKQSTKPAYMKTRSFHHAQQAGKSLPVPSGWTVEHLDRYEDQYEVTYTSENETRLLHPAIDLEDFKLGNVLKKLNVQHLVIKCVLGSDLLDAIGGWDTEKEDSTKKMLEWPGIQEVLAVRGLRTFEIKGPVAVDHWVDLGDQSSVAKVKQFKKLVTNTVREKLVSR